MKKYFSASILLLSLIGPVTNIEASSQMDTGSIEIYTLNEVYNLSNLKWFFKAEDNLNFKEIMLDSKDWLLIPPIWPWNVYTKELKEYHGNAWYRLNLNIDELDQNLKYGIMLPYSYGSIQVYFNGQLIEESRKFSPDGKTSEIGSKPILVEIPAQFFRQGNNVLAMRVSSTDHWGGFGNKIYFGPLNDLNSKWVLFILRHAFIAFICIFLSFYYFLHYWQRKKELYYLWFAGLNLSIGIFVFSFNGISMYLFDYYWSYALLTFLGGIITNFVVLNFLHSFLNRKIGKTGNFFRVMYLLLSVILLAEYIFTGGIFYFQKYLYMAFISSTSLLYIYLLFISLRAIREKIPYAIHIFWGNLILSISLIYSMIAFSGAIKTDPLVGEGFFAMIIAFSIVVATRFSHTHKDLEKAHENLKALDKLKDDFLANTSHELRTPLIGIIGIAETLIDGIAGELSQKTKENLSMIVYSGKRLSNLVNDIIDFSKLKNKNIELQLNAIDIKSLADVTLALSKPLLSGKPVELINNISKEIPPVEADENRLQQILVNLIGNSIKFTSKGNITIDADVIYYNENELNPGAPKGAKFVQITISDTGIGIPADKFETIFQSFEQADTSVSREYGGSGLGLSITKQLIELHRGEIKVESEVGKGSKFTFTLPVSNQNISETSKDKISQNVIMGQRFSQASYAFTRNQSNDEKEIKESQGILKNGREKQIAADSFENVNVLIVDDEPVNLHVLSNILMIEKCNITKAADGMEALEIVHNPKFKPDIILLDVMMPKMSGFEVCEKIRSKYSSTELPVIMVTAKNQVTDLVTGLTAGANDYITKPYSKNELLARIKTQLSLIKAAKAFGTLSAIEKELSVAKNMQLSALPASLPVSSSWEFSAVCIPVKDVGGDYYDYHQIDDKNLGIIIGDVSGHGIPAALTVSMLKIAFSLQLPNAHNPKMIMENINKILYGHCGHNFITAAYVFINIELKALYYSNAGHPPVYLWKAKTEKLIQLNAKGTAIGFNSSSEFQMKSHEIDNGDKIIMYTDGFTEARNKSDELYEDERLMEEISKNRDLSANNLKNHLVAEINKWSENQIDDLTLVVIDIL